MASFWRHIYFREALKKDFQENFCGKSLPAELKESALMQVNVSIYNNKTRLLGCFAPIFSFNCEL